MAVKEPLVDVVEPHQIITDSCVVKVGSLCVCVLMLQNFALKCVCCIEVHMLYIQRILGVDTHTHTLCIQIATHTHTLTLTQTLSLSHTHTVGSGPIHSADHRPNLQQPILPHCQEERLYRCIGRLLYGGIHKVPQEDWHYHL